MRHLVCLLVLSLLLWPAAGQTQTVSEVSVPTQIGRKPDVGQGALRAHVQLVWSPKERVLERRRYALFDPFAQAGFDLFWQPRHPELDQSGPVQGEGILTWRAPGGFRHGTKGIEAQYIGDMHDGRPHGFGRFTDVSGLRYTGDWAGGLMHGKGHLITAAGDAYTGMFHDGQPDGHGTYIDAAGVLHEGGFSQGHPDGPGLRASPDGAVIAAVWRRGTELPGTRHPAPQGWADTHRHKVQGSAVAGLDISLSVGGAAPFCCQSGPVGFGYAAFSEAGRFAIFPDDPNLMDRWRGRSNLVISDAVTFDWTRAASAEYSFLNYDKSYDTNLPLRFGLRNSTRNGVTVLGAYLEVSRSHVDRQPMVQSVVLKPLSAVNTRYSIENYGWASVENAELTARFVRDGAPSPAFSIPIGTVADVSGFSFEPILTQSGVALDRLADNAFTCSASEVDPDNQGRPDCLAGLLATGVYGDLTDFMQRIQSGSRFGLRFEGQLRFNWTDHTGAQQTTQTPFNGDLPLATLRTRAECEGGDFELIDDGKPFGLAEQDTDYEIALPLEATVQGGEERRWEVALQAAKSSDHLMRVVLELADGRVVKSRDISALLFNPRRYDASIRPFEPRC